MGKEQQPITVNGSNVIIAPSASTAPQTISPPVAQQPVPAATPSSDVSTQLSAAIHHYVTHDAVGVPELIRKARRHIVLHAAFYPKYGFDNQGDDVSKSMEKNPSLRLTAIFTDVNAQWVDEFAFTLRDYFGEKGEFAKHLDVTKQHFIRLRKKFGTERVHIYDTARLPLFPIILIDDTIIVGHYAHSSVIPPNGLWFTIMHPKISSMYESLLAGSMPDCDTPEESAILRYLEELMVV
jgi:hypothetical protein